MPLEQEPAIDIGYFKPESASFDTKPYRVHISTGKRVDIVDCFDFGLAVSGLIQLLERNRKNPEVFNLPLKCYQLTDLEESTLSKIIQTYKLAYSKELVQSK